jgi:hypothetical protein
MSMLIAFQEEVQEPDETQSLQKAMLDYLSYHGASEPAYLVMSKFVLLLLHVF